MTIVQCLTKLGNTSSSIESSNSKISTSVSGSSDVGENKVAHYYYGYGPYWNSGWGWRMPYYRRRWWM